MRDTFFASSHESRDSNTERGSSWSLVGTCSSFVMLPSDDLPEYLAGYRTGSCICLIIGLCVMGALMIFCY